MNSTILQGNGKPLPYRYYAIPVFILLLLGLADTGYLIYSHYRNYTDISFSSFCAPDQGDQLRYRLPEPLVDSSRPPAGRMGIFSYLLFLSSF